jgi:hypothetical protein
MKWEFIDPIEWMGAPGEKELEMALEQGRALARQVKEFCGK